CLVTFDEASIEPVETCQKREGDVELEELYEHASEAARASSERDPHEDDQGCHGHCGLESRDRLSDGSKRSGGLCQCPMRKKEEVQKARNQKEQSGHVTSISIYFRCLSGLLDG